MAFRKWVTYKQTGGFILSKLKFGELQISNNVWRFIAIDRKLSWTKNIHFFLIVNILHNFCFQVLHLGNPGEMPTTTTVHTEPEDPHIKDFY